MCLPQTFETVRANLDGGLSRRAVLAGGGVAAAAALLPGRAAATTTTPPRGRVADLTHVFRAGFPTYAPDDPPIERRQVRSFDVDGYYAQGWSFGEHSVTHVDAPGHFVRGGRLVTELRPSELIAPAAVVDISARAARDPDAQLGAEDLRRYERRHGRIPRGAVVFMHSGWDARAGDAAAFRNADAGGTLHFPGFGLDAIEYLLDRRDVRGIGVDTLSLDYGPSPDFAVHGRWLGADRYGIEAVANLGRIPPRGAQAIVGVIPWEEGSGGPCRLLATY